MSDFRLELSELMAEYTPDFSHLLHDTDTCSDARQCQDVLDVIAKMNEISNHEYNFRVLEEVLSSAKLLEGGVK